MGFVGGSVVKNPPVNAAATGDRGSIPKSGRSLWEENVNPLQYFCKENPIDRGVWQARVHGITKSQIRLNTHTCTPHMHITNRKTWYHNIPICMNSLLFQSLSLLEFVWILKKNGNWLDYFFQSVWSNKDQIYPMPEKTKKKDNIYEKKFFCVWHWTSGNEGQWFLNYEKQVRWALCLPQTIPWESYHARLQRCTPRES